MNISEMTAREMRDTNPNKAQLIEAFDYLIALDWKPIAILASRRIHLVGGHIQITLRNVAQLVTAKISTLARGIQSKPT